MGKPTKEELIADQRCRNCHFPFDHDPNASPTATALLEGVNCEACHGPSRDYDLPHRQIGWRKLDSDEKQKLGMHDMSNPETQARLCLSCHVGQVSDKDPFAHRVVTHDMYAAGHPPLPGFEITTFSEALPHHWRTLDDKVRDLGPWLEQVSRHGDKAMTRSEWQKLHWPVGIDEAERSRTKRMVMGSVVALRQSAECLTTQSIDRENWPRLENYDCFACHHDLRESDKSWRQRRGAKGNGGLPGRPLPRQWQTVLVRVALAYAVSHGKDVPDIEGAVAEVDTAFVQTPFGQPDEIAKAADRLVVATDQFLAVIRDLPFHGKDVDMLLRLVAAEGANGGENLDYDSARQLAWGLRVLWNDAKQEIAIAATIEQGLNELDSLLRLEIPGGDRSLDEQPEGIGMPYENVAAYDPAAAREIFGRIHDALDPPK